MESRPKVSIITPVLNGAKYLEECIESVLSQDYPNIEQVFADGASTDNTLDILRNYQARYPQRIVYHSAKDKGAGDAWNWGIKHATGDILGWLGYDDLLCPKAVSRVVSFFRSQHPGYFVYGEAEIIDEDGKYITMYLTEPFNYKRLLNNGCYIIGTSAFYRREVFETCGLFDSFGSDYEMWLRIGKRYPMHYLKGEVLSQFRLHKNGSSSVDSLKTLKYTYYSSLEHGGRLLSVWGRLYWSSRLNSFRVACLANLAGLSTVLKPYIGWSYPLLRPILGPVVSLIYYLLGKVLRATCYYSPIFKKGEVNPLEVKK